MSRRQQAALLLVAAVLGWIDPAQAFHGKKSYADRQKCLSCEPCPGVILSEPTQPAPAAETAPPAPSAQTPSPSTAPSTLPPAMDDQASDFPSQDFQNDFNDALSSSSYASASPQTAAPYMMGDLLGIGGNYFLGYQDADGQGVSANNATPVNGGRRLKISESTSPMPRDRIFFNYNLFRGAYRTEAPAGGVTPLGNSTGSVVGAPATGGAFGPAGPGGQNFDAHRFTFGAEKTFFDRMTSVEFRLPFSYTLDSNLSVTDTAIPGNYSTELDNISTTIKALLYQDDKFAVSTGMLINLPTADDVYINQQFTARSGDVGQNPAGQTLGHQVIIRNQSVTFGPFLGGLYTPNERLFVQGFTQWNFPLNGNRFLFTPNNNGVVGDTERYILDDQSFLMFDLSAGYWMFRKSEGLIRGFAPMVETHYTTTLNNADLIPLANNVNGSNYRGLAGNTLNRLDVVNFTMGSTIQVGEKGFVTTGVVLPLNRGDHNFLFDWEFLVQLNYQFGPSARPITNSPIF